MRIAVFACWLPLAAQTLEVRSEFLRVNPQGEILLADTTPQPRELISPAVVRNAYATFHIVVQSPRANYFLFVGSNPEGVFQTTLYEEEFVQRGQDWIPDTLKPLKPPYFGVLPNPDAAIAGQSARSYLLDVWVPADAPVGRTRLEVQMKAGEWTVWPMELRVLPAIVPKGHPKSAKDLPAMELRADESAMDPLLEYVGRHGEGPAKVATVSGVAAPRNLREVIRRNAEQDMALARTLDAKTLVPALRQKLAAAGAGEWYLTVRDLIYRLASGGARE